ncbi:hypothetical protein AAVH_22035 [Aphelenchoides avenae]|nr:hypothetical protein AAVH_22035 [Aphelenchus avenae]
MDYGLWTLDRVAGRHDAVSLNPPVGYEKKLAEEKSADKAEGKVKGLGFTGRFRNTDVVDDRERHASDPH